MELTSVEKPNLASYDFFSQRLSELKIHRTNFSISKECRTLRKVSPTLVTLILQKKRRITLDRVDELSQLLKLTTIERQYFKQLVETENQPKVPASVNSSDSNTKQFKKARNEVSDSMLKNFINFYVKDAFQIAEVQKNPQLIYKKLSFLASKEKIDQSLEFLLREGYLRKTLDQQIVLDQPLSVKEPTDPHLLVRKFHKKALDLSIKGLDLVPSQKRLANTLLVPLDKETKEELLDLIRNFTDQLKSFCENKALKGDTLYQLTLHLTPTGENEEKHEN